METERVRYMLALHLRQRKPVCFAGGAGTGKTTLMMDFLKFISSDKVGFVGLSFNN